MSNKYDPKLFLENYKKDCEVFGSDVAQSLYEDVLSAIFSKEIRLGNFGKIISENEIKEEQVAILFENPNQPNYFDYSSAKPTFNIGKAAQKINSALKNGSLSDAASAVAQQNVADAVSDAAAASGVLSQAKNFVKVGIFARLGKLLASLPQKVKNFFGNLKGSPLEIMKKGFVWLTQNPAIALKTAGGMALVGLLIRALKKKGELDKYNNLKAIYERSQALRESCYDTILGDSDEKKAAREILEECEKNKALSNALFGITKQSKKSEYLKYVKE